MSRCHACILRLPGGEKNDPLNLNLSLNPLLAVPTRRAIALPHRSSERRRVLACLALHITPPLHHSITPTLQSAWDGRDGLGRLTGRDEHSKSPVFIEVGTTGRV